MGAPYSGTSVSGYNSNPPPDDGSTGANNQISWSGIKSKLGDPLNTFATSVDSNLTSAFGKLLSGATAVKTNVSYPMSAADQGRLIVATTSGITITTPDATSVHSPFVFAFSNQSTSTITIAGFGGTQTVDGNTSTTIYPGCGGVVWTDGSNWFTNGLVQGNIRTKNPPFGFDAPVNLQLNASVGSNLLTVAVKANDGTDPSSSNPVLIPFRDSTLANGGPVWVAVTSALSINTNAIGATLGTQNSVPFRLWVVAFNNAGTAVLALWHSGAGASSPFIGGSLAENTVQSTTGISAAATSANTFYTPNGTTLSNKAFRILGYVEYATALGTAGTYSSAPDIVQLFGPGVKKPGDVVQVASQLNASQATQSSSTPAISNVTKTINPTSKCNLIEIIANALLNNNVNGGNAFSDLRRTNASGTVIGNARNVANPSAATITGGVSWAIYDAPSTVSAQAYLLTIYTGGAGVASLNTGDIVLKEIMG